MEPLVVVQIVIAATQDILFAIVVGTLAWGVILGWHAQSPTALGRWRLGASCALALACGLYLWLQAAVMSDTPFIKAWSAIIAVLTQSHFGIAWLLGLAGLALTILCGTRGSHPAGLCAAVGTIVYAAGKAATGHAADAGDFTLREAVHVMHLCATALWAGSVIVAVFVLYRWDALLANTPAQRMAFCTQLSHLATVSLGVVIVTGVYNVTQDTAHLSAPLLGVPYGRVLTLKLALVALAVALGGCNRLIYLPRLQAAANRDRTAMRHAQRGFDRLLAAEAVTMLAVLMAAAVLGHTSPVNYR